MDQYRTPDHRIVDVEVRILGPDRTPLARRPLSVSQWRHSFLFGCTGFEFIPCANGEEEGDALELVWRLERHWFELFNAATLPFYWGWFEPTRGAPDTERLRTAARWLADRGAAIKGHPLCWHSETATWLLDLPTAEIRATQLDRIRREVGGFAGGTPKPSFEALRSLLKGDWWLSTTELVTDDAGVVSFRGTAGEYEVRYGDEVASIAIANGQDTHALVLGA